MREFEQAQKSLMKKISSQFDCDDSIDEDIDIDFANHFKDGLDNETNDIDLKKIMDIDDNKNYMYKLEILYQRKLAKELATVDIPNCDEFGIYVIDSHRPFHLSNVHDPANLVWLMQTSDDNKKIFPKPLVLEELERYLHNNKRNNDDIDILKMVNVCTELVFDFLQFWFFIFQFLQGGFLHKNHFFVRSGRIRICQHYRVPVKPISQKHKKW